MLYFLSCRLRSSVCLRCFLLGEVRHELAVDLLEVWRGVRRRRLSRRGIRSSVVVGVTECPEDEMWWSASAVCFSSC